jgi:hypothetical protein
VWAYYDDSPEDNGILMEIGCTSDDIPSPLDLPTIQELIDEAEGHITRKQAREIKEYVRDWCNF